MRVAVEGELYAGVPCEMLDELGVHAPAGKQREARVPEIVPAYIGQSCSLEQGLEMAVDDVLRIERRTLGSGEDEPRILVRASRPKLLLELAFAVTLERCQRWTCPDSVDTFPSRSVLFSQSNLLELSRGHPAQRNAPGLLLSRGLPARS